MMRHLDDPTVARRLALGILALTLLALLAMGVRTRWLPWTRDCEQNPSCHVLVGESHGSIESSMYYLIEGPRYWLIQRQTVGDVTMTYIHNVNFGAFLVYGTVLLGATSPMPAAIISAIGFVAGLAYAYLFAERASGVPVRGAGERLASLRPAVPGPLRRRALPQHRVRSEPAPGMALAAAV